MSTIFEDTMKACLESKKEKASKPILTEKDKAKADNSKAPINEKKAAPAPVQKTAKKAPVKEAVGKKSLKEEEDKSEMGDIADDIVVVIDPNKSSDDLDDFAKEMQDIVQDTPEGEQPSTDEYVGDSTYSCPVCGNTFFSEEEMAEGTQCPVCGETPQKFVLVGQVEQADGIDEEETEEEVDPEGEEEADEEEPEEEADEELELGDDEDFEIAEEEEDDKMEENRSFKSTASRIAEAKKKAAMKAKKAPKQKDPKDKESTKEFESKTRTPLSLDEKTFNPFLSKFITDNYRNATAFEIRSARINGNSLVFECAVKYKSGAVKKVTLESKGVANGLKTKSLSESINSASRIEISMREPSGVFNAVSSGHPFVFTATVDKGIIRCEGLKYDFVTKSLNESFRVYGGLIKESAKKSQAPEKKLAENRRPMAKAPERKLEKRLPHVHGKDCNHRPLARPGK